MITVGTNSFGYNHLRNFVGLPFSDVRFKKVFDLYKFKAHFYYKAYNRVIPKYINRFNDFGLNRVDMYHFFNTITPIKRPWVVTFETLLPRADSAFVDGYRWLADKYCKRIIAYTERAYQAQLFMLDQYPEYRDEIVRKMELLYPSQKHIVDDIGSKDYDGNIVFTITGSTFFLKGGFELLKAFERLKSVGAPVKLNVVSRLEVHGYKDTYVTSEIVKATDEIINTNPLITHYNGLPNQKVLEILKQSHVGVLPSYGETFGYSLLEAMACGCAVISTNVPPFPEFVKDDWGWLIEVPLYTKNGLTSTITDEPEAHKMLSSKLTEGLYETIIGIVNDRASLRMKSAAALERIKEFHSPQDRVIRLRNIYANALN